MIFETCLLTDPEISQLSRLCAELKTAFVKTSTGFVGEGGIAFAALVAKNCRLFCGAVEADCGSSFFFAFL